MKKEISFVIGQAAALAIAAETTLFAISLIWEIVFHSEFAITLGYIVSLLLAVSVVIMMASFYVGTQGSGKIFGLFALVSSILYAAFCTSTYFLQLSIVPYNPLNFSQEILELIVFKPGSVTFAIDMLGYFYLCLSTLAAGFALPAMKNKALRTLCFIHGAIALPTFAAPIISGIFRSANGETNNVGSYVLLFWCAIFIPIALLFMKYFKEKQKM